jgi:uncharacterized membrane protein
MRWSFKELFVHWRTAALIVIPSLLAAIAWTATASGDAAIWRQVDLTGRAAQEFSPTWKLAFMLQHPLHFPAAVAGTVKEIYWLWLSLIGVLGLVDTYLRDWVYPVLSLLLIAACLTPMGGNLATRGRIAAVAGLVAVAYCLAVFLIFYLIWTPIDAVEVLGVQGRYFVPCLPLLAVAYGVVGRGLDEWARAGAAVGGATLSGLAITEAILRVDWDIWSAATF